VRLASAFAGSADQVPFYLMPTLGGADINGDSALRSYHDYRFRAAHTLAGEIEYAHVLIDPIGVLLASFSGKSDAQAGPTVTNGTKAPDKPNPDLK